MSQSNFLPPNYLEPGEGAGLVSVQVGNWKLDRRGGMSLGVEMVCNVWTLIYGRGCGRIPLLSRL